MPTEVKSDSADVASDVSTNAEKPSGEVSEAKDLPKEIGAPSEADRLPKEVKADNPDSEQSEKGTSKEAEESIKERVDRIVPERMEPPVIIKFECKEGVDRKEFIRQLKAQERGLNSQTVAENMENRRQYQERKAEKGSGRAPESYNAQQQARNKAEASRLTSNLKNGMTYSEAKAEVEEWSRTQAALHNPDQIAGGDPVKVSRMGDRNVNSSIGAQWSSRVSQIAEATNSLAEEYTQEELASMKMNVKLEVA